MEGLVSSKYLSKANKTRGTFGEILIFNDEVAKVATLNISKIVEHVAITQGDGLGYDILSYNDVGDEIYIEAKPTTEGKFWYYDEERKSICEW